MQIIETYEALALAIADASDPDLHHILKLRADQWTAADGTHSVAPARFHVAAPGDSMADIKASLGFSPLTNLVDGTSHPDVDFTPSWEWMHRRGQWVEITFILSDDGPAEVVLAPCSVWPIET